MDSPDTKDDFRIFKISIQLLLYIHLKNTDFCGGQRYMQPFLVLCQLTHGGLGLFPRCNIQQSLFSILTSFINKRNGKYEQQINSVLYFAAQLSAVLASATQGTDLRMSFPALSITVFRRAAASMLPFPAPPSGFHHGQSPRSSSPCPQFPQTAGPKPFSGYRPPYPVRGYWPCRPRRILGKTGISFR